MITGHNLKEPLWIKNRKQGGRKLRNEWEPSSVVQGRVDSLNQK